MNVRIDVARKNTWEDMRQGFAWPKFSKFNIAEEICEYWARKDPDRCALMYLSSDGSRKDYTYRDLSRSSNQLANVLRAKGIQRGERCAVLLPQSPETALTHLACYKIGAIVVPLFTLFGEDGLQFRLTNSGTKAIVTDHANLQKILNIRDQLPDLEVIISIDEGEVGVDCFWPLLAKASDKTEIADTTPDDPAFISYTSGTTGPPKGALHGHRVLLGHLPGVQTHHNFLPQQDDCMWTPADWAWIGGLCNVMLPSLYFGVPLVTHRMAKFDPERAYALMQDFGVRNTFMPPTALKLLRQADLQATVNLRSVGSGGEALGAELLDWGKQAFGVTINEFYGQTECNLVLGNCTEVMSPRPGSTGKPVPGHDVEIVDTDGNVLPAGEVGEIAVRRPDQGMFLEYWNAPEKTAEKFIGDWMLTGDVGQIDEDGYFHFSSRTDDVITSSGYRVGPSEIEDCLTGHPNVTMAAVIGVPDPVRTESIKAFVVLSGEADETLEQDLKNRVRERISPHVAPREVAFVKQLPMTATGKIMRRELKVNPEKYES